MSSIGQRVKARFRKSTHTGRESGKSSSWPQSHTKSPETPSPPNTSAHLEAITQQNQLTSPFLRLPAEIRNTIYHHALSGHEIYALPSGLRKFICMGRPSTQFTWHLYPISQILALHLPLVCRQIRSETGKYFAFKFNSFGATMPEYFALLMESLSAEQRGRIEVVRVNYAGLGRDAVARERVTREYAGLAGLGGLRVLVLRDLGDMDGRGREEAVGEFRRIAGKEGLVVEIERIC
ncbi:Nn.00g057360.m01.CDS01 [Neocucurbitaria sp. VM-36]